MELKPATNRELGIMAREAADAYGLVIAENSRTGKFLDKVNMYQETLEEIRTEMVRRGLIEKSN